MSLRPQSHILGASPHIDPARQADMRKRVVLDCDGLYGALVSLRAVDWTCASWRDPTRLGMAVGWRRPWEGNVGTKNFPPACSYT